MMSQNRSHIFDLVVCFLATLSACSASTTISATNATGVNATSASSTNTTSNSTLLNGSTTIISGTTVSSLFTISAFKFIFPSQSGFVWQQGDSNYIYWISVSQAPDTLVSPATVRIVLSRNNKLVETIAEGIPDIGMYLYTLPVTVPANSEYYVTVYSESNPLVFLDSVFFSVIDIGSIPEPLNQQAKMLGSLSSIPTNSRAQAKFSVQLLSDISTSLNISSNRLQVCNFTSGSILFTLLVLSPANATTGISSQTILQNFESQVVNALSPIKNTVLASTIYSIIPASAAASANITVSANGLQTSGAVGGAIAAAISLGLAAIFLLVVLRKHQDYLLRLQTRVIVPEDVDQMVRPAEWFDRSMFEMGNKIRAEYLESVSGNPKEQ